MALLTVQELNNALDVEFAAAAGGGDTVAQQNGLMLLVRNGSGAPITVTITTPRTYYGLALADFTHSVPAGEDSLIDLSDQGKFRNPSTGLVNIAYSDVTTVEVAAVKFKGRR